MKYPRTLRATTEVSWKAGHVVIIRGFLDLDPFTGSTNRRAPGCVNAAVKLRQKW